MIVFYVMIMLSFCLMLPLSWKKVNYAQDQLRLTVAKSVGPPLKANGATSALQIYKEGEADKIETGLGQMVNDGERELWNSEERTRFLAYLNAYELKATIFGWELGAGFMGEITVLYVSMAFLLWQVTTLSKWTGFSFDKALV